MATTHSSVVSRGKENGVKILKSIDEGPIRWELFDKTLCRRIEDMGTMHGVQVQLVMGEQHNRVGNTKPGQARQDAVCEHHEEHEMHDDVQPNYVVDSHANYTSDSNMILYDQYVKDNAVPVVQRTPIVDNSLTAELATYKEQVELELEAEVDQNVVNRKHDEIERKNLLIANDNLIVDCLSKEVFKLKNS
ncbi:hypothetical protein Tco_1555824 [Tanacetum coccineum]